MTAKVFAALVKAQANNKSPEGRMAEAALIKSITATNESFRCNDATPLMTRFEQRLIFGASECWYWAGHVDDTGYGRIVGLGENKAHRVAYRLFKGSIPEGMKVLHRCDTRCCVNPDHLFLGTQADNVRDMREKGRGKSPGLSGIRNPMARATPEMAAKIRNEAADGVKQIDLSRKYGLSPMTVSRIVRRKSWN